MPNYPRIPSHDMARDFIDLKKRVDQAERNMKGSAWYFYTPVWTATTTMPELGLGSITGKYSRVGTTVFCKIKLIAGSGTSFGTGTWLFSLPFPLVSDGIESIGSAIVRDSSPVAIYPGVVWLDPLDVNNVSAYAGSATTGKLGPSTPITWASGDDLYMSFFYETST